MQNVVDLPTQLNVDELNRLVEPHIVAEDPSPYGAEPKGCRDLRIYKEAMQFVASIYRLTQRFPKEEQFGLTSQLRRAAVSITCNVAEGWGRNGGKEFARFIDIAIGSVCEVESLIDVSSLLGYIQTFEQEEMQGKARVVGSMLYRLRASLRSQA